VALHAKCEVVCKVGILGSVPGLVHRSCPGRSMGGQGGEQAQSFCLVDSTKQTMDGRQGGKYGGQTNSVCKLCNTRDESALHMIVTCSYAKQVWHGLEQWSGIAELLDYDVPTNSFKSLS
jgi:hypothetical protein